MIIFAISERGQGEAAPYGRVATDRAALQRELSSTVDLVNVVNPIAAKRATAIRTGQQEEH